MPDILTPPPGLPEERAKKWVQRHKRRARRYIFTRVAGVFVVLLWGGALLLCLGASRKAKALISEPMPTFQLQPQPLPLPSVAPVPAESPAPSVQRVRFIPEVPLEPELQETLWDACDQYGVPYELALAVAETESSFDVDADNGLCIGTMQINRGNISWLVGEGVDPTIYEGNLQAGALILGQHLDTYAGDWHKALMAYNCGAGGAAKLWAKGYTSSKYSRAVVATAETWKTIIEKESF